MRAGPERPRRLCSAGAALCAEGAGPAAPPGAGGLHRAEEQRDRGGGRGKASPEMERLGLERRLAGAGEAMQGRERQRGCGGVCPGGSPLRRPGFRSLRYLYSAGAGNTVRCMGFPHRAVGEEPSCQRRRPKRWSSIPGWGKSPRRRAWQPAPVFLPGEAHQQRSLEGNSPWGRKET